MPFLPGHHNSCVICAIVVVIILCSSFQAIAADTTYNQQAVYNPATGDYRPQYNFSYSVFKDLPPFPIDFWLKKALLDDQGITAKQLTPEYLQPELIPGWNDWHDKIYGEKNRTYIGVYGISIYPSRFDISNMKKGEVANISALLYTAFGVELYQGAKLTAMYDNTSVDVKLTEPDSSEILLTPTYPSFNVSWCRVIVYKITMLNEKNTTIVIMETKPSNDTDNRWGNEYGNKYISGGSILGLRVPKLKIYIHSVAGENNESMPSNVVDQTNQFPYLLIIVAVIAIAIVMAVLVYAIRRKKNR